MEPTKQQNDAKLIIIGAGNVGGFILNSLPLFSRQYEVLGFLDDDPAKIGQSYWGIRVLGPIDDLAAFEACSVVVGIASPKIKRTILTRVASHAEKFHFPAFVSSNAWLSQDVEVGRGAIIYPGVSVNYGSRIGDFCVINMNCALGHHAKLDKYCSLAPGVNLGGITSLGEGVDMGIGSATKQSTSIGEYSVIGGQGMVVKDLPANITAVGVPAKPI